MLGVCAGNHVYPQTATFSIGISGNDRQASGEDLLDCNSTGNDRLQLPAGVHTKAANIVTGLHL